MARVYFSQRSWQRLGLRPQLRASDIAEEGEYARELTKFYSP